MTRKLLLICGLLASLLYVAMNVIGALQWESYRSVSQTISELSAIGAPSRPTWLVLGPIYSALTTAFGTGVWISARGDRALRVAGGLIIAMGLTGAIWPFASMHQRAVLAAGGGTFSDRLHIIVGVADIFFSLSAIVAGMGALGRRFRLYSIASITAMLVSGVLTGLESPRIPKGLPTPYVGLWERASFGVFLLWVAVLAIALLRAPAHAGDGRGRPGRATCVGLRSFEDRAERSEWTSS